MHNNFWDYLALTEGRIGTLLTIFGMVYAIFKGLKKAIHFASRIEARLVGIEKRISAESERALALEDECRQSQEKLATSINDQDTWTRREMLVLRQESKQADCRVRLELDRKMQLILDHVTRERSKEEDSLRRDVRSINTLTDRIKERLNLS